MRSHIAPMLELQLDQAVEKAEKQEDQRGQGAGKPRQGCPAFSASSSGL